MKNWPKKMYITHIDEGDFEEGDLEYFVSANPNFDEEEDDTEVAIYQLVKVGSVKKSSKLVFDE